MSTAMNEKQLAERVHGRHTALNMLELAEPASLAEEARKTFWIVLRDEALTHAPLPAPKRPGVEPMTNAQAHEFEKVAIPFGKHQGRTVGDIVDEDPDYLDWLCGQSDHFKDQLNRYMLYAY